MPYHYTYIQLAQKAFCEGGIVDPRETVGCSEEGIGYLESRYIHLIPDSPNLSGVFVVWR